MSDILAQLAQLAGPILQSPQGQEMAKAIMSQMQGDPRGQMQGQGTMGRGPVTDMEMGDTIGARNQMRPDMPPAPTMDDDVSYPDGGHMGMNQDGPTPEEIELLRSKPTDQNCENFDKLFGDGAAAKVLGGESSSYEDDVRGAMKDADEENHRKGIYGRRGRGEPLQGDELDDDD